MHWNELIAHLFFASGTFFVLVAGIGVVRLPDMLCRAHAVAKALTLGLLLLLVGAIFAHRAWGDPRYLLALLFQFVTIPVAGHLVSLVAWRRKLNCVRAYRDAAPDRAKHTNAESP